MLAQMHDESQNSDSFRKSGYDRKVSGGAKSATDGGGLSGRQGEERNKQTKSLASASVVHHTF